MFKPLIPIMRVCLLLLAALTACVPFERPATRYPIIPARNMLLDTSVFPQYWEVDPCGAYCDRDEGYGKAMRTYGRPDKAGSVILVVTNYVYESSAEGAFQRAQETNFPNRNPQEPPFSSAQPITYTSSFADQYQLGCGIDGIPSCRLYARYGNYFIYLFLDIDDNTDEGIEISEVDTILEALDKQIATQLRISPR